MLEPFARMWYGDMGRLSTVEHRLALDTPYIRPVHPVPYRAGQKPRDVEKHEFNSTMAINITLCDVFW